MQLSNNSLFSTIQQIIIQSRSRVYRMVNATLLQTYWQIGKIIVEDEQQGNQKAQYGKATLKILAQQLTVEFGKGFDERNLNNMRSFYKNFPIWNALRTELSWTHIAYFLGLKPRKKEIITLPKVLPAIEEAIQAFASDLEGF